MWKASLAVLLAISGSGTAAAPIDTDAARQVFADFRSLCTPANTSLWGVELCGPLMLVGPDHEIVTNRAAAGLDPIGGGLFRGALPDNMPVANTAIDPAQTFSGEVIVDTALHEDGARFRLLLSNQDGATSPARSGQQPPGQ